MESATAERAGENTHQRDADLHGGKKFAGGIRESEGQLGSRASFLDHGFQPGLSGCDHGDLRHREQTIREKQAEN